MLLRRSIEYIQFKEIHKVVCSNFTVVGLTYMLTDGHELTFV